MPLFRAILRWLGHNTAADDIDEWFARQPRPKVTFPFVTDVDQPPSNHAVQTGVFYRVMRAGRPKWALFLCPCGCRSVITLSLQPVHQPHWVVRIGKGDRPSMRPSVWRDIGCLSHFWIEDGRIYWCTDSGSRPWSRSSRFIGEA